MPNGRALKVLNITRMSFSNDAPALMLNYQTDLKTSDRPALEREVEEIWTFFRTDVERAGLTRGIIRANEVPKGFILTTGTAFGFVYHRGPDGSWSRQ
ncbi:MAG TPA: hypothetical protein VJ623_06810 [Holophagaceae bacterium]|nr:hypothetical protein [Holophagaceae bacterium]